MNSRSFLRSLRVLAILAGASGCAALTSGCATPEPTGTPRAETRGPRLALGGGKRVAAATGKVLTRAEMQRKTTTYYFGDEAYAEVNSAWLRGFYDEFRNELHRLGIVQWDERFDCNRFTELYVGLAQARFYRESFHSMTPARALAIGPYWYMRENGRGAHAVVQALTERGRIFFDPQSGEEVQLTPKETALAYFQFF